jgi:MOSC domain-containing protein YiiM
MPELLSIQVGMPQDYGADALSDKPWRSGIHKTTVQDRIRVSKDGLPGDGQEYLKAHGGPFRRVLAYAAAHYPVWRVELALPDMPYGAFGENFTVSELTEESVCLGDVYTVGEAVIQVAQPRQPCSKLARRWGIKDLTARVEARGWGGWYHSVLQEGYVQAGDPITLQERPYPVLTIALVNALETGKIRSPAIAAELAQIPALTETWRERFARMAADTVPD